MVNASKDKGDRGERESVTAILNEAPDLCLPKAMRLLGAGRVEDVGDLYVIHDVAIQVKAFKKSGLSTAIYSAAAGATVQAGHGDKRFALGLVLVPRARLIGSVRWVSVVDIWPVESEHVSFTNSLAAFEFIKKCGPDGTSTAVVHRKGSATIILSSLQNWVRAYREATNRPNPVSTNGGTA